MAQPVARGSPTSRLLAWISPQLTQLVDAAPDGDQWFHEIKYDDYRMHARLDCGAVKLLTRTGLDWTHKYAAIAKAVTALACPSPGSMEWFEALKKKAEQSGGPV
jgi:ATP-dependent DNA ligase